MRVQLPTSDRLIVAGEPASYFAPSKKKTQIGQSASLSLDLPTASNLRRKTYAGSLVVLMKVCLQVKH